MAKDKTRCTPENGVDRCPCGSKYWSCKKTTEHVGNEYVCFDCGEPFWSWTR